jgi:catechol 2,3-dioxygenase-like lactoylglutathione lyase family enzyme
MSVSPPAASSNTFGNPNPILLVVSLPAAIEYYVNVLGFRFNWKHGDFFASVCRDRCNIFLSEGDQGHAGTWVWIGVNDVTVLETEFRARGAKIRHSPTNYSWALEMHVEDLDGNVLRFGSDPIQNQPYGEWLDMHGRLWPTS